MSDITPLTQSDTTIFSERGYTFNQLLGEGSYAKVWLVNYSMVNEEETKYNNLACKVIDSTFAQADFINRFLPREMDILSKISHPHLIHLHSIYQRKTKIFIFMRFAEKGDLLDYILDNGEVSERQARLWTRQLSLGLQYLHNLDIVHRDIKCENVLITANNNVKLGDFGFARFMVDISGKKLLSSTYCGSLAYAAPELLKGKPYNPKHCDVWSLGIVIFVMLNQCMPFSENDTNRLYEMQINSRWKFRTKINAIVSEDAKAIVHSMLIPDVYRRIIIDDVVNHHWFSYDDRLRNMSQKEREALEIGLSNKSELIPKTSILTMPSWKKRKKYEKIVCITSMRVEQSSNQFQFLSSDAQKHPVATRERIATRNEGRQYDDRHNDEQKQDERRQHEIKQDERRQHEIKQDERRQHEIKQDERRQDERRQHEIKQDERRQHEIKQDERQQSERSKASEQTNDYKNKVKPRVTTSSVDLIQMGSDPVASGTTRIRHSIHSKDKLTTYQPKTSSKIIPPKAGQTKPKIGSNEDTILENDEQSIDSLDDEEKDIQKQPQ